MNDTHDQGSVEAGKTKRCGGRCGCSCDAGARVRRRKRDELILMWTAIVAAFVPVMVVLATPKERVEVAAVGDGGKAAGEAREKMEADGSKMVKPSLLFSEKVKLPGAESSLGTLAVAFEIEKGWHTYWRNAGDSGLPPTFEFTVEPAGTVEIGEAQWPVPQRHLGAGDILDYIYEGRVLHLFEVKPGPAFKAGQAVKVVCKASWLVCKEACLPGEGEARLLMQPKGGTISAPHDVSSEELEKWAWLLPRKVKEGEGAPGIRTNWKDGVFEIALATTGRCPIAFFPFSEEGDLVPNNLIVGGATEGEPLKLRFDASELKPGRKVRGIVRVDAWRCIPDANTRVVLIESTVP